MVNPSPYMIYLQARGSILVASSPEILCHVSEDRKVTNRLAASTASSTCVTIPCCHGGKARSCCLSFLATKAS